MRIESQAVASVARVTLDPDAGLAGLPVEEDEESSPRRVRRLSVSE
jgi:hypothetical protein